MISLRCCTLLLYGLLIGVLNAGAFGRKWPLTCGFVLVGGTGFEPVTSSVSGKRATTAPTARVWSFEVETGFEPV
jgi:hypothetical protein